MGFLHEYFSIKKAENWSYQGFSNSYSSDDRDACWLASLKYILTRKGADQENKDAAAKLIKEAENRLV